MNLKEKRRIAADVLKIGVNRVWFDEDRLDEITKAITKADIRRLVSNKVIQARPKKGNSRFRTRKRMIQKKKGRRSGPGHRRGTHKARASKKRTWMILIRNQRRFLKDLKDKGLLISKNYQMLYLRAKGGFFRSRRHLKLFIAEHKLIQTTAKENNNKKQKKMKK